MADFKMDYETAVGIIDSVGGATDDDSPFGQAWSFVQDEIRKLRGAMAADDKRLADAAARVGCADFGCDAADHMADKIIGQRIVIEQLRAAVDCLPKTADGVRVIPGRDLVYDRRGTAWLRMSWCAGQWRLVNAIVLVEECYSTKEAALAAGVQNAY